ncbi:MAG: TonB-dependent receptor [Acidobacteriota bacterium]
MEGFGWRLVVVAGVLSQVAYGGVRLSGRVVDENNVAVPGAQIVLRSAGRPGVRLQAVADPTGAFAFEVERGGDYLISAEREGYFRLAGQPLKLERDGQEITLVLNPVREIFERVTVAYSPPAIDFERTAPRERLTSTQIQAVPYPSTNTLRNAMRVMPGVVQDARGGIHLSGGTEEQVLYTLDGFQINDPLTGRFESRLSVDSVRTMEVSTGNVAAEFGKGAAGTLAIRTSAGDDRWRYSATNFVPAVESRKGLFIDGWTPRFGVSGPIYKGRAWFSESIDLHYMKHVVEELPKGEDRTTSWRTNNLLRNQINLTPSNILYTGFLINAWTAPRHGLSMLDPPETTVDRRSRQWFFNIKDQLYFGRGALLEAGYGANRTFGREVPQGQEIYQFWPEGKRGNFFADAVRKARRDQLLANLFLPSFTWGGGHQLKLGLDVDSAGYWQDVRRTGYENFRADNSLVRAVRFGGSGRLERPNLEAACYAQDSWKVRPGLLVEMGLRHDWDQIVGNHSLAPRIGAAWMPARLESTKISASFGMVYDATNLRVFTRPLDQYSLSTYYHRDGSVRHGPAVSVFTIGDLPLKTPRYRNWNLALEQRLPGGIYARFQYLRRRGRYGFTYENIVGPDSPPSPEMQAAFGGLVFDAVNRLGNLRRDVFDSFELTARQTFMQQYEWMASYTRARAFSNAVVDVSVDDPIIISRNVGPMPWDAPNRLVSWGYLPLFRRNWALAYMVETRNGFPFSVQDDEGKLVGELNERRFPASFELNLHIERRFFFKRNRWALRAGFNNITNHKNYNTVNNNTASSRFLTFYGGQSRSLNFRIRWLGRS